MLNEDVKTWVNALRGTKYMPGTQFLRPTKNEFCCLGVACDLFAPDDWLISKSKIYTTSEDFRVLPPHIQDKLDLRTSNGEFYCTTAWWVTFQKDYLMILGYSTLQDLAKIFNERRAKQNRTKKNIEETPTSLAALNDRGCTFYTIAAVIESEPPGLFNTEVNNA